MIVEDDVPRGINASNLVAVILGAMAVGAGVAKEVEIGIILFIASQGGYSGMLSAATYSW